jgi:hypothetical protein
MTERMTSRERSELGALIRARAKVARAVADEVKTKRLADFEVQLTSAFSAEDERFRDITAFARQALSRANQELTERCEQLGIPEAFRPQFSLGWIGRWENATAERRAELRRVAHTQADADQKEALRKIEVASVEAQTELLRAGLDTAAAHAWLESMPTPEQLMPPLNVASLLQALPDHRHDRPLTRSYSYRSLEYRIEMKALDQLTGRPVTDDEDEDDVLPQRLLPDRGEED